MYNFIGLFVILGVLNFRGVESELLVEAQLGRGPWAAPSCSCPVNTRGYIIQHPLSSKWKMEIRTRSVRNDPNTVKLNANGITSSYRATDCLKCPNGPSRNPGPAGSCPFASYNYLSPPRATTWLRTETASNDRIVITDILPTQQFIVRRLAFKVKHIFGLDVWLKVGWTIKEKCWSNHIRQNGWTMVRCDFCGNLNLNVDKIEFDFAETVPWDPIGIKSLKIWTCEY